MAPKKAAPKPQPAASSRRAAGLTPEELVGLHPMDTLQKCTRALIPGDGTADVAARTAVLTGVPELSRPYAVELLLALALAHGGKPAPGGREGLLRSALWKKLEAAGGKAFETAALVVAACCALLKRGALEATQARPNLAGVSALLACSTELEASALDQAEVAGRPLVGPCQRLLKGRFFDRPAGDSSGLGSADMLHFCGDVSAAGGTAACTVRHVYARLLSGEFDLGALAELALAAATVLAVLAQEHPVLVQGCLSRRAGHSPVSGAVLRGCWTLLEAVHGLPTSLRGANLPVPRALDHLRSITHELLTLLDPQEALTRAPSEVPVLAQAVQEQGERLDAHARQVAAAEATAHKAEATAHKAEATALKLAERSDRRLAALEARMLEQQFQAMHINPAAAAAPAQQEVAPPEVADSKDAPAAGRLRRAAGRKGGKENAS